MGIKMNDMVTVDNGQKYVIKFSEIYNGKEYALVNEVDANGQKISKMKMVVVKCDEMGTHFEKIEDKQEHQEVFIRLTTDSIMYHLIDAAANKVQEGQ